MHDVIAIIDIDNLFFGIRDLCQYHEMTQKQYDLILYGATGFTGRLTAAYLKHAAGKTKWAIAGRSEKKLQELKAEFGLEVDVLSGVDSFDLAGINGMVQKTRAVISLVGPYEVSLLASVLLCSAHKLL